MHEGGEAWGECPTSGRWGGQQKRRLVRKSGNLNSREEREGEGQFIRGKRSTWETLFGLDVGKKDRKEHSETQKGIETLRKD